MTRRANSSERRASEVLARQIESAARRGVRACLLGPTGSGRRTVLRRGLELAGMAGCEVDFGAVRAVSDMDRELGRLTETRSIGDALRVLEQQAGGTQAVALVVLNFDGLAASGDERYLVGWWRSQLQSVPGLPVFYTASDPAFLFRHVADSDGTFNGRMAILEMPHSAA